MAIKQVPVRFRASDGREFESEKEAKAWDDFVKARGKFSEAQRLLGRELAKTQKTADGKLFEWSHGDYYYISDGWAGMPELVTVSFYFWSCGFGGDESEDFVIRYKDCPYKISELYTEKRNAERALLAAQEKWLAERTKEVKKLRSKLSQQEEDHE